MRRAGFTLMELMLVVVIIGIVYGLFITNMQRYKDNDVALGLENLPQYLQALWERNRVALVCVEGCKECFVTVDGNKTADVEPFVDDSVRLYRFDRYSGSRQVELSPYFDAERDEKESCFRYELFADGSSERLLVEYRDGVVLYPGYFGEVRRFGSMAEAVAYNEAQREKVIQ